MGSFLLSLIVSFPVFAFANESTHDFARDVQIGIEFYQINLNTLKELAAINSANADESVERDLSICNVIGETDGKMGDLYHAVNQLLYRVKDSNDQKFLDSKGMDILNHNVALRHFCFRSQANHYRDVEYLKTSISNCEKDFSEVQPLIEKYL